MIIDRYTAQTIAPTAEPISLAQAKRQLRVDGTDDDTFIAGLITAARSYVENYCSSQLVVATYQQKLDKFPCGDTISLNYPPLIDVTSITYVDSNGTTQTLATTVYSVLTTEKPGKIKLKYGQSWPSIRSQPDAVTITFRAGYARPFTASGATMTFQYSEPVSLVNFFLSTTDGDLPAGLYVNKCYDTIVATEPYTNFGITLSGTYSAINTSDAGTGTHFVGVIPEAAIHAMLLLISHWYTSRNAGVDIETSVPQVGYLLSPLCWGGSI